MLAPHTTRYCVDHWLQGWEQWSVWVCKFENPMILQALVSHLLFPVEGHSLWNLALITPGLAGSYIFHLTLF